jgi:hypothetical protein
VDQPFKKNRRDGRLTWPQDDQNPETEHRLAPPTGPACQMSCIETIHCAVVVAKGVVELVIATAAKPEISRE